MKIEKVYNNNVVHVLGRDGREWIVMGRGLGFQKKVGQAINPDLIEKRFVLDDQNLTQLYLTMTSEELDVLHSLILRAEQLLETEFGSSLYLALGDHLQFVFARSRDGLYLENPLSWEIRKFYPKEYQLGLDSLDLIKEKLGLPLPVSESSSIALHFINAMKNGKQCDENQEISKIVRQILDIVRLHFGGCLSEEETSYHRFVTHIHYLAQRIVSGLSEKEGDAFLYEQVSSNYPDSFSCAKKIFSYVANTHQQKLSQDELVYLTIHIQKLKQAQK